MAEELKDGHGSGGHEPEHHGGSLRFYLGLAIFLGIVTALEIGLVTLKSINYPGNDVTVRSALIAFSVLKFAGVVAFFMHLYYDQKFLTVLFVFGLVIASCTMVALLHLMPKPIQDPPDENPSPSASAADDSSSPAAADSAAPDASASPAAADSAAPADASASPAAADSAAPADSASPASSASPSSYVSPLLHTLAGAGAPLEWTLSCSIT